MVHRLSVVVYAMTAFVMLTMLITFLVDIDTLTPPITFSKIMSMWQTTAITITLAMAPGCLAMAGLIKKLGCSAKDVMDAASASSNIRGRKSTRVDADEHVKED